MMRISPLAVQKTFRDRGLTKHIKYVLRLKPDPRHLQDAGDLQQQFTDLRFCGQPFNMAISFLARVSGLFCTTKELHLIYSPFPVPYITHRRN